LLEHARVRKKAKLEIGKSVCHRKTGDAGDVDYGLLEMMETVSSIEHRLMPRPVSL